MAQCNWDPSKHGGKPCPIHGASSEDRIKRKEYRNELKKVDEDYRSGKNPYLADKQDQEKSVREKYGKKSSEKYNIGSDKQLSGTEREKMQDLVDAFNEIGVKAELKDGYEDYGANMKWTAPIIRDDKMDMDSWALNPKQWIDYMNGVESIEDIVEDYAEKNNIDLSDTEFDSGYEELDDNEDSNIDGGSGNDEKWSEEEIKRDVDEAKKWNSTPGKIAENLLGKYGLEKTKQILKNEKGAENIDWSLYEGDDRIGKTFDFKYDGGGFRYAGRSQDGHYLFYKEGYTNPIYLYKWEIDQAKNFNKNNTSGVKNEEVTDSEFDADDDEEWDVVSEMENEGIDTSDIGEVAMFLGADMGFNREDQIKILNGMFGKRKTNKFFREEY